MELSITMFDYIEVFYNRCRRHSTFGLVLPPSTSTHSTKKPPDSTKSVEMMRAASQNVAHSDSSPDQLDQKIGVRPLHPRIDVPSRYLHPRDSQRVASNLEPFADRRHVSWRDPLTTTWLFCALARARDRGSWLPGLVLHTYAFIDDPP